MIKTDRWMVAAYNAGAASHKGNVKATFLSAGEVGFNLDISNEHRSSIEYRCGPPDNSQTPLHLTHSSGTGASASTTVPYAPGRLNQCIFLQRYKVRYTLWVIPQIHARAGHHELPENHDDDNDDGPTVVTDTETDDAPLEVSPLTSDHKYTRLIWSMLDPAGRHAGLYSQCMLSVALVKLSIHSYSCSKRTWRWLSHAKMIYLDYLSCVDCS